MGHELSLHRRNVLNHHGDAVPLASAFPLTADGEARIRQAAQDALTFAFTGLTAERVLPRSRHRPWIHMARDYYGYAVEQSDGPLSRTLEAALPQRFDRSSGPAIDHPWNYPAAILEASVAAATLAGEEYSITSPSVQGMIDHLIDVVRAVPRSTVLQLLADVDVEHAPPPNGHKDRLGQTIEIADVRVIRVKNEAERFIERELPSAGYEVERSDVVVFPGPASILVATAESTKDFETRTSEARGRVSNLIAAMRLATGSTAHAVIDIAGDPNRVHWIGPVVTPFRGWGVRFAHRPLKLAGSDVPGLEKLVSLIGSWGDNGNWTAVRLALGRLSRSLDGVTPGLADQVVDLAIGLEAALAGTDTTEISLRLRTRAAEILATDSDPPEAIYRDVKTLYDLRSTIVHGAAPSAKQVSKLIKKVTGTETSSWAAEQYMLALDRWRDLLRRAVLARVALTTAAIPWAAGAKRGSQLDVDELLLRETDRNAWRLHIQAFWADRGLPQALSPSPPLRLTFGNTESSEADTSATV